MKTVGIIGAMDEEIVLLKEKIEVAAVKEMLDLSFIIGRIFNKSIILVRSGIGKVNAAICAQILIDHFAVDYIINIGVAGSVNKEISIGDIVISSDTVQHDMDTTALGDKPGVIPRMPESFFKADEELVKLAVNAANEISSKVFVGRVASGDQFISMPQEKKRIKDNFSPYCVEMEGAAIAQTCYLNSIPFVIIRSISDSADEGSKMSYEKFVPIAAKNSSDIVEKLIEKM